MIKKTICFVLILIAILLLAYIIQPIKKGAGYEKSTKYQLVKDWLRLPADFQPGNPTGIGMDSNQHIIVFHRAGREWPLIGAMPENPIMHKTILVIDHHTGQLIRSWGDSLFVMPHGLTVDQENNVWVTDVGLHQVFKFTQDGMLLFKLGEAGVAGNDRLHFDKPTDIAVADDGSFYVSDGYGNSRIVKFSATGEYLFEWGKNGRKEGEFDIPHGVSLDHQGNVYVADRENNRIQVFDSSGKFIHQLNDESFGAMTAVSFDRSGEQLYAADDFRFLKVKHRGSDVFVIDTMGKIQSRFGRSGSYEGPVRWYHDLTVDRDGNIYVADILGNAVQKFRKVQDK